MSKSKHSTFIVTGGAGFIGSNFLRLMTEKHPESKFINVDKLTYAGNPATIEDLQERKNHEFVQEDICNATEMQRLILKDSVVVNFAAETHVDNSITGPLEFSRTNVLGTHTLLEIARKNRAALFVQISTDEVYGSLNFQSPSSKENDALNPSSPYSASKAAAEMLCLGNAITYGQQIIRTRSSNNFGPYQFPEKVIPLFVTNLMRGQKVPLYGNGQNVRDWIYVEDNCRAIDTIIRKGSPGEVYNIGGGNELSNLELTKTILEEKGFGDEMIEQALDRAGHDLRYSIDSSKVRKLGWHPFFDFRPALAQTIEWYHQNESWWRPLKDTPGKRTS